MQKLSTRAHRFLILGSILAFLFVGTPFVVSADEPGPICLLAVIASGKALVVQGDDNEMLLSGGKNFHIIWAGGNADTAVDRNRDVIPHVGLALMSPEKTTTYSYTFSAGNEDVTCSMKVYVVSGNIDASSLQTDASRPTLSGEVSGLTTVRLEIFEKGNSKVFYTDDDIDVRNEEWEVKIAKQLPDGTYDVVLRGDKKVNFNTLATETLTVGDDGSDESSSGILVVESIPLLSGGIVHAGGKVSISYLQVTNIGKESAVVQSFSVKQNGSASTQSVIGLTSADDKNTSSGSVGGIEGNTPFKNGVASIPVNAIIAPGQMLLFTLKALVTADTSAYIGKQLMLDVVGINSNGTEKGAFPIRGTTWTISY